MTNAGDLREPEPEASTWPQANRPRADVDWCEAVAFSRWLSQVLTDEPDAIGLRPARFPVFLFFQALPPVDIGCDRLRNLRINLGYQARSGRIGPGIDKRLKLRIGDRVAPDPEHR